MDLPKAIEELCEKNEFMNYNHIHLKEISQDHVVTELTVVKESLNPYGIVHGGAFYTMGDCAAGIAARSDGRRYVTLSSSFNFLRGGQPGDTLQAAGIVRHRGRTTCLVDVAIHDTQGRLLASGSYTFFCIDGH